MIGDLVTLNPQSGLIGSPTQTIDGLTVNSLLNPNIRPGAAIHVETGLVNTASIVTPLTAQDYMPTLDVDGRYKAYSVTHVGDTRGQEWYTESICAAIDPINGQVVGGQKFIQAIPGS